MAIEAFSGPWAEAVRDAINASDAFRRSGARWDDAVVFANRADGAGVLFELRGGRCIAARPATAGDRAAASFVIVADAATWRDLLEHDADLLPAIMRGRFGLERGSLASLVPHVGAAHDLLAAAATVDTRFPVE